MLKRKNKQQSLQINDQQISSIIGEGYIFTGELTGPSVIRIEGKVIGNVNVDAGVILGENGIIEGDIKSQSVIIYGTVNGNIKTAHLEVKKNGCINGNIAADSLEIELGAKYNGTLNMQLPDILKEAS
jgi:Integral membrane protein CcmA involved in cell shape determination